jgi:hypothetical protein
VWEELSAFLAISDRERITREFYERMRKYNCWVISVIQQFGRFYPEFKFAEGRALKAF